MQVLVQQIHELYIPRVVQATKLDNGGRGNMLDGNEIVHTSQQLVPGQNHQRLPETHDLPYIVHDDECHLVIELRIRQSGFSECPGCMLLSTFLSIHRFGLSS